MDTKQAEAAAEMFKVIAFHPNFKQSSTNLANENVNYVTHFHLLL